MIIHPNDSCSLSQGVNCILEPNKEQFKQLGLNYSAPEYATILKCYLKVFGQLWTAVRRRWCYCGLMNIFATNSRGCPLLRVMLLAVVTMATAIMN